ncbi:MAG: hypothetical protein NWF04_09965 [Candidatus Bathyarchaeota archaeon]|nr:hypothetical protein [Candidatus Bathyarchaeota archaeon]
MVKLSFARIDGLIGSNLPMAAYRNTEWWSNKKGSAHAKGWLDACWEVHEVNLQEGYVYFKKTPQPPAKPRERRKRKAKLEITQPFTPVPVRPFKSKIPSKTKASKLYARILNLERQKKAGNQISGFKPKSRYEKKLFGSNEKPTK